MSSSRTRVDIDDADPRIHYSAGWSTGKDGNAYGRTLHYAQFAGLTATLRFNGTMVGIMGCGGDTASIGYPSTSIVIDGKNANLFRITTNTPTSPAALSYNLTLFSSTTLQPGAHTIVLTNLNETSPNLFVLDRFWYIASDASDATSVSEVLGQPSA
ncbi:uncharacterized protein TRAVEDRAFT_43969 [Trametes versicolor FP-101664 SS1]|uniref:uncharacterized protein n=1 Tax=Trametes versicolor (strain FP-101664) TaxID=717944 RepID=UPI00046214D6|nr:uncharacterized protein TRAVEDRAFT_43969 [Trametes versicolor FP-101664 SS1]EIW61142.1 hypothetical protein TRAVEDRAFT_43969 [Trametes versicolor FP-101664 SS1]